MKTKKILFITSGSLQDPKRGTPIRIYNFIQQMQKEHQVIVSAPAVDAGFTNQFLPYPTGSFWSQVNYFRKALKKYQPDLVMTATDIDIDLPFWLKFLTGVKIAIDLHGLVAAEMYFQDQMSGWKSWLLQQKINFVIRWYDLVFAVSGKLLGYYGSKIKNGVVIYGGVTENEFYHDPLRTPEIFTIGYTGNSKSYQGIDAVLDVAGKIKKLNLFPFRLNLIMSSGRGEIEGRLAELGLSDVADLRFKVSHEEVPAMIAQSSVLVIARPKVDMTEYAYPSKLPEYLATGVPVITTDVGPIGDLFADQDCIIVISPDRIEAELEEVLVRLYRQAPTQRQELGARAVKFVREHLRWEVLGERINQSLEQLRA